MKKLLLLVPALPACAILLTSCTTVVKEPATSTTTHTESSVTRAPTQTSTTVTRESTGY